MLLAECLSIFIAAAVSTDPSPGIHGHYAVLTGKVGTPPPFETVDIVYGPREEVADETFSWWQLSARAKKDDETPLFILRALTSRDPMSPSTEPIRFQRYILRLPATDETLEYSNVHTDSAILPGWRDFDVYFVPRIAKGSYTQEGLPETAEYLGHVLTLHHVGHGVAWELWGNVQVLALDPELLVGTGRNFKDSEGHRLPQKPERQNYDYITFTEEDYRVMIDTGINLFTIAPDQQKYVKGESVFYLRPAAGDPPLMYPADLYRSNYLGSVMFMDEPAIIMVGDKNIHDTLRYFSDAGAAVEKRVRERYYSGGSYSAFHLEKALIAAGVNFGDMRLEQHDFPAWETYFDMAYYEVAAEVAGVIHESRYQMEPFDEKVAKWTDTPREHTQEELLRYHYAFLRGAARSFDKYWGASIYGQCDPEISPLAIKMAYDMGARYIWFWTSDHEHHMPWPEQLELVRTLRQHTAENPRQSISAAKKTLDKVITIPYGYFLSLENLWWVRSLDEEGKSEASQRYDRLMRRSFKAIHEAMDRGEDFDITVDDGGEIQGYGQIIKVSDEADE